MTIVRFPYWSKNDLLKLRIRSQFRIQSFDTMNFHNTEFTMHQTCNNKNDLKVGIDFQCSMNMVPKCRAQFMHD